MTETIAIGLLAIALVVLEIRQQGAIKFTAYTPKSKYVIAPVIATAMVVLFWSGSLQFNLRLLILAGLLCSVGMVKQGLGETKVITYGSLLSASEYHRYDLVTYEPVEDQTRLMVTFRSKKAGSYSLFFDGDQSALVDFLKHRRHLQVMPEAEYARQQADAQRKDAAFSAQAVQVIRNRKRKSVKQILRDSAKNRAKKPIS